METQPVLFGCGLSDMMHLDHGDATSALKKMVEVLRRAAASELADPCRNRYRRAHVAGNTEHARGDRVDDDKVTLASPLGELATQLDIWLPCPGTLGQRDNAGNPEANDERHHQPIQSGRETAQREPEKEHRHGKGR